jgi:hypothetical protein
MTAFEKIILGLIITFILFGIGMCVACSEWAKNPEKVIDETIEEIYK